MTYPKNSPAAGRQRQAGRSEHIGGAGQLPGAEAGRTRHCLHDACMWRVRCAPRSGRLTLLAAVDAADIVILAFPLYVDGLPYLVTQALEQIAARRAALQTDIRRPRFLAIANCGFPEVQHNATALAICRQFADEAGFALGGRAGAGRGRGDLGPAAR